MLDKQKEDLGFVPLPKLDALILQEHARGIEMTRQLMYGSDKNQEAGESSDNDKD